MFFIDIPSCPSFMIGDGEGGTEEKISSLLKGKDCVDECRRRRKKNNSINGVTTYKDGRPGCWCESNMNTVSKSRDSIREYQTCSLGKAGWNT